MSIGFRAVDMNSLWTDKVFLPYYSVLNRKGLSLYCPLNKKYMPIKELVGKKRWKIDNILIEDLHNGNLYEGDIIDIKGRQYEIAFNDRDLRVEGIAENSDVVFGSILNSGVLVDNIYFRRLRAVEFIQEET